METLLGVPRVWANMEACMLVRFIAPPRARRAGASGSHCPACPGSGRTWRHACWSASSRPREHAEQALHGDLVGRSQGLGEHGDAQLLGHPPRLGEGSVASGVVGTALQGLARGGDLGLGLVDAVHVLQVAPQRPRRGGGALDAHSPRAQVAPQVRQPWRIAAST